MTETSKGAALSDADIDAIAMKHAGSVPQDFGMQHKWLVQMRALAREFIAAQRRLTAEQPTGKFWCEACNGTGKIDERLTAYSDSNPAAECPDCDGNGWWQSARAPVTAEQPTGHCKRVGEPCECAPEAQAGCVSWVTAEQGGADVENKS